MLAQLESGQASGPCSDRNIRQDKKEMTHKRPSD